MPEPAAPRHRHATPTGEPCPRTVRVDGTVDGNGACLGCGVCLLFGGLVDEAFLRPGVRSRN